MLTSQNAVVQRVHDTETVSCVVNSECLEMVRTLEARHGSHAAEVAEFFVTGSWLRGCSERAVVWADVASRIRLRQRLRMLHHDSVSCDRVTA